MNKGKGKVGVIIAQGPPVPIPNTEVKLCGAENTCLATDREDRSMPTFSSFYLIKLLKTSAESRKERKPTIGSTVYIFFEATGKSSLLLLFHCSYLPIFSSLAQLAEHLTVNQVVAGSSPAGGAKKKRHEHSCLFLFVVLTLKARTNLSSKDEVPLRATPVA